MARSRAEKAKHAAAERERYAKLKRGLIRAIADANGMGWPVCSMPVEGGKICGDLRVCPRDLEIDHRYGSRFTQRKMNSVQRLEQFAIEFIKWVGGDAKSELRLACRSCNAKHQPKRRK
jgi:hypothetical protein